MPVAVVPSGSVRLPAISEADGVGHGLSTATAHPSLLGFVRPSPEHVKVVSLPAFDADGVGHAHVLSTPDDKEAVALVGSAHSERRPSSESDTVAQRGKLVDDGDDGEEGPTSIKGKDAWRLLENEPSRSKLPHHTDRFGPSPTAIARTKALTCRATGLAGRSSDHGPYPEGVNPIMSQSFTGHVLIALVDSRIW